MSYEGYTQYLCEAGHKYDVDLFSTKDICPVCGKEPKYEAEVDQTNGIDEDDPNTFPAPTKETGFTDTWKVDHYGNKYALKHIMYEPEVGSRWIYCPLNSEIKHD